MKIYLVGGAIRDTLLNLPVKEKDWVVVGATPEMMLAQGFKPVGKEFPVFLHPQTKEEYALARTERKVAKGYKGFTFYTDIDVTLEQDLARRDLTMNAIAQDDHGELIDPYHGQDDIKAKQFRHVSPAFAEDPVRILRLARFGAKLPDFTVHPDTNALMQQMVLNGEVDALVAERVWQECSRAMSEAAPWRFFSILDDCGALAICFPGVDCSKAHCQALKAACQASHHLDIRLACAWYYVSTSALQDLIKRYRVPKQTGQFLLLVNQYLHAYKTVETRNHAELWQLIKSLDAIRRPQRFAHFLQACAFITNNAHAQAYLEKAASVVACVDVKAIQKKKLPAPDFADALKEAQIDALRLKFSA